jgi:hypothetical protein
MSSSYRSISSKSLRRTRPAEQGECVAEPELLDRLAHRGGDADPDHGLERRLQLVSSGLTILDGFPVQ